MRSNKWLFALTCPAMTLLAGTAKADETTPDPMRAAGWAVIGLGGSLGAGTAATGIALVMNDATSSEMKVGTASIIGGAVTFALSLAIGVPLALHSSSAPRADQSHQAVLRALRGEIRF